MDRGAAGDGQPHRLAAAGRIGLLTYHHVTNEGALLQAYSLMASLQEQFGWDRVEVIDYRPLRAEWRDLETTLRPVRPLRRWTAKLAGYWRLKRFVDRNMRLSPSRMVSDNYPRALRWINGRYDGVVVGSDEVWKVKQGRLDRRFPNMYWLHPRLRCRKISFAASANKTLFHSLSAEQRAWMGEALSAFDLVGVRDAHTEQFVRWLGTVDEQRLCRVPDPAFMLDGEDPDGLDERLRRLGLDFSRPRLGLVVPHEPLSRAVAGHFRARGFQIVALGWHNAYADLNLSGRLSPQEWAGIFARLTVCVSARFHPAVFCLKSGTPICAVDYVPRDPAYSTKNHSLMSEFGLGGDCYLDVREPGFAMEAVGARIERAMTHFDGAAAKRKAAEAGCAGRQFLARARALIDGD